MPSTDNEQQSFASPSAEITNWLEKFEQNDVTFEQRLERFKKDLINQADEFHNKFPTTADKVDELEVTGLTKRNRAFTKLRTSVEKAEKQPEQK